MRKLFTMNNIFLALTMVFFFFLTALNYLYSSMPLLLLCFVLLVPLLVIFWKDSGAIAIYILLAFSIFLNFRFEVSDLFTNLPFSILMVLLIGTLFFLRGFLEKNFRMAPDMPSMLFLLFLLLTFVSIVLNPVCFTLKDSIFALLIYVSCLLAYLVPFGLVRNMGNEERRPFIANSLAISSVVAVVLSVVVISIFLSSGAPVVKGSDVITPFGSGGPMGCFFMLVLTILCSMLFADVGFLGKAAISSCALIIAPGLLFCFSRSTILAAMLSVFLVVLFSIKKPSMRSLFFLGSLVSAVLLFPIFFMIFRADIIEYTFNRVVIWLDAYSIFKDHFWLGIGAGNYTYYSRFLLKGAFIQSPHNNYLQMAVESGLPGLIAFLLMIYQYFKGVFVSYKRNTDPFFKQIGLGVFCASIGFAFASFFGDFILPAKENLGYLSFGFVLYLWVFLGIVNSSGVNDKK